MVNNEQLLNGNDQILLTPEFETAADLALKAFRNRYPNINLADMQTFVLGFRMGFGYASDEKYQVITKTFKPCT